MRKFLAKLVAIGDWLKSKLLKKPARKLRHSRFEKRMDVARRIIEMEEALR